MKTRESVPTLGCESCDTRELAPVVLGNVDFIRGVLWGAWVVCHVPSVGVISIFCLFEGIRGSSSVLWGAFPCVWCFTVDERVVWGVCVF
jgi:hypothetical protein